MRVRVELEVDEHNYVVELEADRSVPVNELIQMAASQADLLHNVTIQHRDQAIDPHLIGDDDRG